MPNPNKSYKERVAEILGLETDPHGKPNMFLIRDEDDEVTEGIDFNDELEEIDQLISQALDNQIKEVMECLPSKAPIPEHICEGDCAYSIGEGYNQVLEEFKENLKSRGLI